MTIEDDIKEKAKCMFFCKTTCMQHDCNQDFIDSMTQPDIIDLWFSPEQYNDAEKIDFKGITQIMNQAGILATLIHETLPDHRVEKTRAVFKLQEAIMWACCGLRRAGAVSNILQRNRGVREFAEGERNKSWKAKKSENKDG